MRDLWIPLGVPSEWIAWSLHMVVPDREPASA